MTVWAKISTPATAMACAACIATAATLPVMGTAAEQLAKTAAVKLSALTDIDAFSALGFPFFGTDAFNALPAYLAALGDPAALTEIDSLAAIPVLLEVLGGDIDALAGPEGDGEGGYAALSAVPSYLSGDLTNIDAISALGNPFFGTAAFGAAPNIVNSLGGDLSRESGLSGIDAFSGLPAINAVLGHLEIGALAPDAEGVGGIAAFSAIPSYLGIPAPTVAPDIPWVQPPDRPVPPAESTATTESTATAGANSLRVPAAISALVPQPNAAPAPTTNSLRVPAAISALVPKPAEQITPAATVPDNSGAGSQNIVRDSKKFTPESTTGNSPILFGTANRGVENGMPGWQSGLKKLGLGGEQSPGGATPGTGPATG